MNAGGLNPKQLAVDVQNLIHTNGGKKKIAYVTGDNLVERIGLLDLKPLTRSTGEFKEWKSKNGRIVTANAYIGCWGIVGALKKGADIVICGRVTDASPVCLLLGLMKQLLNDI